MQALHFDEPSGRLQLRTDYPIPEPKAANEALVRVLIAGVCSTDVEISKGYVPGFSQCLGHEFVGRVERCPCQPSMEGTRVVGEINCNDAGFSCSDALFQRNHAPGRSVLGIINKDGCIAEYVTLPVSNLHVVPGELSDSEAAFAEPLAAACRILEQGLAHRGDEVAVVGDGKLGLTVAQVLVSEGGCRVTLFGRHASKMALVEGLHRTVVISSKTEPPGAGGTGSDGKSDCSASVGGTGGDGKSGRDLDLLEQLQGSFPLVVEASGSPDGVLAGLRLTRAMGTLVLKTTVSVKEGGVQWAQVANDVVVNEKVLVGSRCGPMDVALEVMVRHASVRRLLGAMVTRVFPLSEAEQALRFAQTRGVLKVQVQVPGKGE